MAPQVRKEFLLALRTAFVLHYFVNFFVSVLPFSGGTLNVNKMSEVAPVNKFLFFDRKRVEINHKIHVER